MVDLSHQFFVCLPEGTGCGMDKKNMIFHMFFFFQTVHPQRIAIVLIIYIYIYRFFWTWYKQNGDAVMQPTRGYDNMSNDSGPTSSKKADPYLIKTMCSPETWIWNPPEWFWEDASTVAIRNWYFRIRATHTVMWKVRWMCYFFLTVFKDVATSIILSLCYSVFEKNA